MQHHLFSRAIKGLRAIARERALAAFVALGFILRAEPSLAALPQGFVYVDEQCAGIIQEIRYYSEYNFIGERIDGYRVPRAILSRQAGTALCRAVAALRAQGYVLKVFDAYRPQAAVNHFVRWSRDAADTRMKDIFYPDVDKARVFALGYLSARSAHSRGSTVDVTLVDAGSGCEVDMGTPFDFLDARSHHGAKGLTAQQTANREILRKAMRAAGFISYVREWWHYTLAGEPYPDTYFTFPVE